MLRRIKLLGRLTIEENGRTSPLIKKEKGCALLAYLVVTGQPQSREAVADLLWDTTDTAQSLLNLRVLLSRVRPLLPELKATRTTLAFQPGPELELDLTTLTEAMEGDDAVLLDQALRLYSGELLAGFHLDDAPEFNEWLLFTRERLRRQVMIAFDRVCSSYVERQAWAEAVDVARRWVALDDLDERAYRWLMLSLAGEKQFSQALQQYELCRQRLWEELGVEPEPATAALAEQLAQAMSEEQFAYDSLSQQIWPRVDELAEPGPLPIMAVMPFHRNNDFVGRQETLLALAELLLPWPEGEKNGSHVAAITGMGGIGKTQLAVEFCYRYGRYFSGSVYWLNFDDAGNIPDEVANIGGERSMGLFQEKDKLTLADKVGRVQKAWQEPVPRLLIFDNCEEEQLLAEWLPVTGGCRVLVTSRRRQWSPEFKMNVVALDVLRRSESISLLQQLSPHLDEGEAAEIAEEVGYLPLALHLAGGFLRRYRQISPAQYLAQLRDRGLLGHPSLQGRGLSLSPTGHELNVARTFTLNLTRLDQDDEVGAIARQLLIRAACFAPGETIPQDLLRETVIGDEEDFMAVLLAEDGLGRLVDLGFLQAEGLETVTLHRLLAAVVYKEMAAEADIEAAQTAVLKTLSRALTPYLERARYPGPPPIPISHLRYACEAALAWSADTAAILTLALGRYLRNIGEYAAAQQYLEMGAAAAKKAGDIYNQGRNTFVLSRALYSQGRHQKAQQAASEADGLLRQSDAADPQWLIVALIHQGWSSLRLGRAEAALAAAEDAAGLSARSNNLNSLSECQNLLGSIYYFLLGDFETADDHFDRALELFRQIGQLSGEATVMMNQGESATTQGDYGRAEAKVQEALRLIRQAGNRMKELSMLINLSEAQVGLGNYEAAVANLTMVIAEAPSDWTYAPIAYQVLATGYLGLGKAEEALAAIRPAALLVQSGNDPYSLGQIWRVLGLISAQLGQPLAFLPEEGVTHTPTECFAESLKLFTRIDNQRERANLLWQWAGYELARGNTAVGRDMWEEAREIFGRLKLPMLVGAMDADGAAYFQLSTESQVPGII